LLDRIEKASASGPVILAKNTQRDLLAWCGQYGLLGVLFHRAQQVTVPVGRTAIDRIYTKGPLGWEHRMVGPEGGIGTLPPMGPLTGRVVLAALDSDRLIEEPLTGPTWSRFVFVPKKLRSGRQFSFAPLQSETFWKYYREPVGDFLEAAKLLRQAVRNLVETGSRTTSAARSGRRKVSPASINDNDSVRAWGLRAFGTLLRGAGPAIYWDEAPKRYEFAWAAPSLLGVLALQAAQDLAAGQRIITCFVCGTQRVTRSKATRFCSQRCYWKHHKAGTRSRAKQHRQNEIP
jgi:hypothetical protein